MAKSRDTKYSEGPGVSGGLTSRGRKDYIRETLQSDYVTSVTPALSPITNIAPLTNAEQLGKLIHGHRLAKNISQADLADLASISIGTIKNAEQGRNIGVDQLFAIARALGMNIYA